jgi:hypothetical protein
MNSIFENTGSVASRSDAMQVIPFCKWTAKLYVSELTPFNVILVLGDPLDPERSHLRRNGQSVTIFDRPVTVEYSNCLPRRLETLEGAGTRVPIKHRLRWR